MPTNMVASITACNLYTGYMLLNGLLHINVCVSVHVCVHVLIGCVNC
jgi:hypothetical protein